MQLIIVLCLVAKLALVSGDCDVGKTVNDFDYTKFAGTWYFYYHLPNDFDDNVDCVVGNYGDPVGNVSGITSLAYGKIQRKVLSITGNAHDWDNRGFTQHFISIDHWTGRAYIVGIDYDRYLISKTCSESSSDVLIYVAIRSPEPDDKTKKDIENALRNTDIDIQQLRSWNTDNCTQIQ